MMLSKDMTIRQLISTYPQTISLLMHFEMACFGCPSAQDETLEEACYVHGYDVEELMDQLEVVVSG
ncbi:MAG TPA: disulfide oxidoreductase [Erysipelotrichaceae bacterium]|nr:disulfide oxidoreductase [Erysipelotrichaceae bacterium]